MRFPTLIITLLATLMLFPGPACLAAAKCSEDPSQESGTIIFFGQPVTDPHGNVIGVTIPLKRAGRLFLFEGSIDNLSGNFILDTGASGLVLNKTYFRNAICVSDEEGGGVTGAISEICRTTVKLLKVGDMVYQNVSADVIPLGHLENRRGIRILGLFGMSMMKNLEMVIDLRHNELQLFKLDNDGKRLDGSRFPQPFDLVTKVEVFRNVVFLKATVGEKTLDFCLDTGAESNVFSISAPKKAMATVSITRRSNLNGAGADQGEVLYGILNDFNIGTHKLNGMETIICSLDAMAGKYAYPIDGMLGYDFFVKGKICINLVTQELGMCLMKEENP